MNNKEFPEEHLPTSRLALQRISIVTDPRFKFKVRLSLNSEFSFNLVSGVAQVLYLSAYQTIAYLGQGDELLVSWGAHVESDGQHLLQGSYDQRGLDGVVLASTGLVFPLLVAT